MGFTLCKTEQPLQGMELHENGDKNEKYLGMLFSKNPKTKGVINSRI